MPERDEVDQLIDSELARYGEPRVGLEQRILARISLDAERSPRRRRLLLFITTPVAAALLIFAYVMQRTPAPRHTQIAVAAPETTAAHVESNSAQLPSPASVSRTHKGSAKQLRSGKSLNAAARPKLNMFPTLQPLSDSERAITTFVAEASEAERKALVTPNQEFTEPIRVTALHIPPLPSPGEDSN